MRLKSQKERNQTFKNIGPGWLIASSKQNTFSNNYASVTDNRWFPIDRISNESGRCNNFNQTGSNQTVEAGRAHTSFIVCSHTPKERMWSSQSRASRDLESFELGERVYSENVLNLEKACMYRILCHGIPEKLCYHTPQRGSVQKSSNY